MLCCSQAERLHTSGVIHNSDMVRLNAFNRSPEVGLLFFFVTILSLFFFFCTFFIVSLFLFNFLMCVRVCVCVYARVCERTGTCVCVLARVCAHRGVCFVCGCVGV